MGIRTPDIQLAKLALYQLSYTPLLRKEARRENFHREKEDQVVRCVPGFGGTRGTCNNILSWARSDRSPRKAPVRLCSLAAGAPTFRSDRENGLRILLRKEVIQPQVPLRLPCYDFIPVTSYTLGHYPLAVGACTSGATSFHDVTGGVYKTRERIHGAVDDAPLLAIPTSWRRVAASNPNWAQFCRFPPPRGIGSHCAGHCSTCAALGVRAILT